MLEVDRRRARRAAWRTPNAGHRPQQHHRRRLRGPHRAQTGWQSQNVESVGLRDVAVISIKGLVNVTLTIETNTGRVYQLNRMALPDARRIKNTFEQQKHRAGLYEYFWRFRLVRRTPAAFARLTAYSISPGRPGALRFIGR